MFDRSRSASTVAGGRSPPLSGSTSKPSVSRNSTNLRYSDSGFSRSATVVNVPEWPTSQTPAMSQLPLCGSATTAPVPSFSAASRFSWPLTSESHFS